MLHSGHALRVTGAQALARACLTEHQISLLARWGSSAVIRYIRAAPLTSYHLFARKVLDGWRRAASTSASVGASAAKHRPSFIITKQPTPAILTKHASSQSFPAYDTGAFNARITTLESEVAILNDWRASVLRAADKASVDPAPEPTVVESYNSSCSVSHLPYVRSGYDRVHRVVTGCPAPPRRWVTFCGWRFGASDTATPEAALPAFYLELCERCFGGRKVGT